MKFVTVTDQGIKVMEGHKLPEKPDLGAVYILRPVSGEAAADEKYYRERVDRNVGWITAEEQMSLREKSVAIAGCGGMGSAINERHLRLGVGTIFTCDREAFDESNINRQAAASRRTVGENKAFATARMLRGITDDTTIVVFPQGICEEIVDIFVNGIPEAGIGRPDVIVDEIEFFANAARLLLYGRAEQAGIDVFLANTTGFRGNVFHYAADKGMTLPEVLGMSYREMVEYERRLECGEVGPGERKEMAGLLISRFVPEVDTLNYHEGCLQACINRATEEGKVPIITPNPTMVTGFLVDRILLHLLRDSGVARRIAEIPVMPGYGYFDAARMVGGIFRGQWW